MQPINIIISIFILIVLVLLYKFISSDNENTGNTGNTGNYIIINNKNDLNKDEQYVGYQSYLNDVISSKDKLEKNKLLYFCRTNNNEMLKINTKYQIFRNDSIINSNKNDIVYIIEYINKDNSFLGIDVEYDLFVGSLNNNNIIWKRISDGFNYISLDKNTVSLTKIKFRSISINENNSFNVIGTNGTCYLLKNMDDLIKNKPLTELSNTSNINNMIRIKSNVFNKAVDGLLLIRKDDKLYFIDNSKKYIESNNVLQEKPIVISEYVDSTKKLGYKYITQVGNNKYKVIATNNEIYNLRFI